MAFSLQEEPGRGGFKQGPGMLPWIRREHDHELSGLWADEEMTGSIGCPGNRSEAWNQGHVYGDGGRSYIKNIGKVKSAAIA